MVLQQILDIALFNLCYVTYKEIRTQREFKGQDIVPPAESREEKKALKRNQYSLNSFLVKFICYTLLRNTMWMMDYIPLIPVAPFKLFFGLWILLPMFQGEAVVYMALSDQLHGWEILVKAYWDGIVGRLLIRVMGWTLHLAQRFKSNPAMEVLYQVKELTGSIDKEIAAEIQFRLNPEEVKSQEQPKVRKTAQQPNLNKPLSATSTDKEVKTTTVPKMKPSTAQEKLLEKRNLFKKSSEGDDSLQSLQTEGDDEPLKSDRSNRASTLLPKKQSENLNESRRGATTTKKTPPPSAF